jgi:phosphopantothenoylcysteine decarboxylase/phosphopantothenate--cysteine ligase
MPSITIRGLDDELKRQLRLRAARHNRSVEDEVRTILRGAAAEGEALAAPAAQTRQDVAKPASRPGGPRILLIIGGGIAAYKSLDLIRRLRERGISVRVIMTEAAQRFVTPLAAGALAGEPVFADLFDAKSELDVGHIRLAREADLVVVAPATADLLAKMAGGHADDLASAVLLATGARILNAPAMNPLMWNNAATKRNITVLKREHMLFVGPNAGEMAESGEAGVGRMAEPMEIVAAVEELLAQRTQANKGVLAGQHVLVTSGPTHEPIDPVRYIANRSSGKQGHAIAAAAENAGAKVTLVAGPVNVPDPPRVNVIKVETARDMLAAVEAALPADVAVFAAAVADWRTAANSHEKIKKTGQAAPELALVENPDILATIAHRKSGRPRLVVGFAAETENIVEHARTKLVRKGCDWILANDVSPQTGIMGGDNNTIHLVSRDGVENWPPQSKEDVAEALIARIAAALRAPR